jgi:hypothetical protein
MCVVSLQKSRTEGIQWKCIRDEVTPSFPVSSGRNRQEVPGPSVHSEPVSQLPPSPLQERTLKCNLGPICTKSLTFDLRVLGGSYDVRI